MEKKLRSIGLDDREIALVLLKDGMKYSMEQAKEATGLSDDVVNKLYDSGLAKIQRTLGIAEEPKSVLGNLKGLFAKPSM